MKRAKISLVILIALTGLFLPRCGKDKSVAPVGFEIVVTAPKTQFTGDGLVFYASFTQAVTEGDILWHYRNGGLVESWSSIPNGVRSVTGDTIRINWNGLTSAFSGPTSSDTIYVEMAGSNDYSNKILVSLLNHAPVLDSVKMNNMTMEKTVGDTLNTLRMHLNPTVSGVLRLYFRDVDGQTPIFFVRGIPNTNPDSAYQSQWKFDGWDSETLFTGEIFFQDGKGGRGQFPLEIVVYDEAHSVWVGSTNGPDTSRLSKLTAGGRKLFTVDRFQQVKFVQVFPVNTNGTEAVWVVDRTRRSKSGAGTFTDSVFILDDDGRVMKPASGGFKNFVTDFALDFTRNIAYVIDSNMVKKITQEGGAPAVHFTLPNGTLKGISCQQNFPDEYWVGAQIPALGRHEVFHIRGGAAADTLTGDTLDAVTTISASHRNNLYWVCGDTMVVIADMGADTVMSRVGGFYKPYGVADPTANSPVLWIADAGSSRLIRLSFRNGSGARLGRITTLSAAISGGFALVSAAAVDQPRSIALDHSANALWVADFNNNRILKVNATTGAAIAVPIDYRELEIENPEAISVNVGVY